MRQNPKGGPPLPIGQRWHHQPLLRTFRAVFRTTLFPVFDALGVQNATQYVVTDTGKVFYTAATDQDNRVLLKVVAFARDVADDFETVGQANLRNTTHGRVRFLRRCCINACANAALLRAFLQVRRFQAGAACGSAVGSLAFRFFPRLTHVLRENPAVSIQSSARPRTNSGASRKMRYTLRETRQCRNDRDVPVPRRTLQCVSRGTGP